MFCLKWNNHVNNMVDTFKNFLLTEEMVDVTLACDGRNLKAHKIILSACSPFFRSLFLENPCKHPIVILKDVKYKELKAVIEFMYHGEANVPEEQLSVFMEIAEILKVKGLTIENNSTNIPDEPSHEIVQSTNTSPERRKSLMRKRSASDLNSGKNSEKKILPPYSTEIEETIQHKNAPIFKYSQVPSSATKQTLSSRVKCSFEKQFQQQQQIMQSFDKSFSLVGTFSTELSKLVADTLSKDDLPQRLGDSCVQSCLSNIEIQALKNPDHSADLVQKFISSDAISKRPECLTDIKPGTLDLVTPVSHAAEPSHVVEQNCMMIHMDQSSRSEISVPNNLKNNSFVLSGNSSPQDSALNFKNYVMDARRMSSVSHNMEEKLYTCKFCGKTCSRKSNLQLHFRTHTGEKPYSCSFCDKKFSDNSRLRLHIRIHTGEKPYECSFCHKKFAANGSLRTHIRVRTGEKPYECSVCNKMFADNSNLRSHIRRYIAEKLPECNVSN